MPGHDGCYEILVEMMRRGACLALVLTVMGCLGRSLPTPPPGATVESVTDCGAAECPGGGVTVHLTGTGMAGAQVVVEDQNPATMGAHGEALGAIARVTPAGDWRATLGPMHDTGTGPCGLCSAETPSRSTRSLRRPSRRRRRRRT